jgi:acetoin utilization protein AcuB
MPHSSAKVDEIMNKEVFTVDFDDNIKKADDIMKREKVRRVPVVEADGKYIGLITERTLLEYTLRHIYEFDEDQVEVGYNKISEFENLMTKNSHLIYPEDSIVKAVEIMTKKRVDYLIVVDWEKRIKGIITAMDILMYIQSKYLQPN